MHDLISNPFLSNPLLTTPVTSEDRERAKKRTIEFLRELDSMRKQLELPIEQLPMVRDVYGGFLIEAVVAKQKEEREARACRVPFTMKSKNDLYQAIKIPPGKTAVIVERPQWQAFRVEDIEIHGERAHWMVHDIKVGNRSQFANHCAPASGTAFGPGGVLEKLRLETCQIGMDIMVMVEYIGPDPEGEVFEATLSGLATEG